MPQKMKLRMQLPHLINVEVFVLLLCGGILVTTLEPTVAVSEAEKRALTSMPSFTWKKLFEGNYTDSLEMYYADHFGHRDAWVTLASTMKGNFGYRKNDLMVYKKSNPDFLNEGDTVLVKPDSANGPAPRQIQKDPTGALPEINNNILIYNKRAFQLFGRQKVAEENFAKTINQYKNALGDSVRVFACVVPSPIDFYLPEEYKSKSNAEKPSIDYIYSLFQRSVLAVDAYAELERSTHDYNYFQTDHHWTARGAYRAYLAFCAKANFTPTQIESYQRHVKKNFLGSLYYSTLDARLKTAGDSLEYFIPPVAAEGIRYPDRDLRKTVATEIVVKRLGAAGSYLTFVGGDYPLTHFITQNKNGKKLLIIKDSYGNALAPFVLGHYQEMFVVDYRSFDSNLIQFLKREKIQDLLFLHNVSIANTKYTASRESYLMRITDLKPIIKPDTAGTKALIF